MDQFLQSLQKIIKQYLFEKKVIIVPSYLDGNTLRGSLCYEGFSALNFHMTTLFDLAKEFCFAALIKKGWKIMDSPLGQIIILQILKKLSSEGKLNYFRLPLMTPGLAKSLFRTIKEMRVAGYSSDHWPYEIASSPQKMKDLYQIMLCYEKHLRDRNLIDDAGLYSLARDTNLQLQNKESIFIVPSNIPMNELELQFFNKKIRPEAHILELACPEAMEIANNFSLTDKKAMANYPEKKVFDFLYRREEFPEELTDPDIEFYQTYGEYTETREVLRYVAEKRIPYDQVQIFYTVQEPYSQYFFQLSDLYRQTSGLCRKRIPMTFHSGINIKNSNPAKLLFSFIDWINDNYSIARLFSLLNSNSINMNLEEPLTMRRFASLLRESPIGWGRDRYIPGIELAIKERQRKIEKTSEVKAQQYSIEIQYYQAIKEWIQGIFAEIPYNHFHYRVSLAELAHGFARIVERYARIEENNCLDEEAKSIIKKKMTILEKNIEGEFTLGEALSIITDLVSEERICCSQPRAGFLHIASYKKGIWLNRPYTFIIGMDSHKFPGSSDEGTVFLEAEKKPYLQLLSNAQKNRIEQYRLLQLVLAKEGKKFLSFSCFDTRDHREQAPASLLLQLYRLKKRDMGKNYHEFYHDLGIKRKLIPQNRRKILDIADIFLYFSKQDTRDLQSVFSQEYPHFNYGLKANQQRNKKEFNAYNGKIRVMAEKIDPRKNRGIVLSSSRLERIAHCPYLYFLTEILKIKPPQEMVYEPAQWMSPLERGLLLHQIYERFYKTLINCSNGNFVPPSFYRHWLMLKKIANDSLEEKTKCLAPPGELIYEAEKREILESCQIFLSSEEEKYKGEIPEFFELAFGTRDNKHEILGKIRSVELTLPDGQKISCQGKIDRVDRLPDNTFGIIDYKTGNSTDYRKGKPFRYGQQIQHALYAIALEEILKKKTSYADSRVSLSGYYFPTIQGYGSLVLYSRENREQVLQIIEILLQIVAQGNFAMIQQPESFMCRDYQDIMEQNEVIFIEGGKSTSYQDEEALNDLRRLRQFE